MSNITFDTLYFLPIQGKCKAGGWCDGKRFHSCPTGTFNRRTNSESQLDCELCPPGFFCTGPGVDDYAPHVCKAGYYCPAGTRYETEFPCVAGTYNPDINQTSHAVCKPCPQGYFCPQGSSSDTANKCPAGYYCPEETGNGRSFACPIGTYSEVNGLFNASQCKTCPAGSYCPDGSELEPTIQPTLCPPGSYNPDEGAGHEFNCRPCDAGRSCPLSGLINSSHPCMEGHYCPNGTILNNQFPCLPGSYTNETDLTSAEQCLLCPQSKSCGWGTGFPTKGWMDCRVGHYCPEGMLIILCYIYLAAMPKKDV